MIHRPEVPFSRVRRRTRRHCSEGVRERYVGRSPVEYSIHGEFRWGVLLVCIHGTMSIRRPVSRAGRPDEINHRGHREHRERVASRGTVRCPGLPFAGSPDTLLYFSYPHFLPSLCSLCPLWIKMRVCVSPWARGGVPVTRHPDWIHRIPVLVSLHGRDGFVPTSSLARGSLNVDFHCLSVDHSLHSVRRRC